jgi:hypothetical protein
VPQDGQAVEVGGSLNDLLAGRIGDDFGRAAPLHGLRQEGDDLVRREVKVTGKRGFAAKQIAGHPKWRFLDRFEQDRARFELFQHPGDLIGFRNGLGDVQDPILRLQPLEIFA